MILFHAGGLRRKRPAGKPAISAGSCGILQAVAPDERPSAGRAAAEDPRLAPLLAALAKKIPSEAAAGIPPLLADVADRAAALQRLDRFFAAIPWTLHADDYSRDALRAALAIFGNSAFLSEFLLRYPGLLRWALDPWNLHRPIPSGELRADIGSIRVDADEAEAAQLLARFKHKHMLRIGLRDFLGIASLAETTLELSNLADAVLQAAHDHVRYQLIYRFGRPLCAADTGPISCYFVVLALGKLGGAELNYSSDIDLMYLHTGDGHTCGPVVTTNHDFNRQTAVKLTKLLSMMTPEGFNFRVDLRLRPEGGAGELVVPMDYAADYYFNRARDWELQMLIKSRPVAGDRRLGRHFLNMVTPRIYRTTTDFSQIEKLAESRDRIRKQRARNGGAGINVKLDPGGIRDIEFLVQCLQRLHGGRDPSLRSGGTLFALQRLRQKEYIAAADYDRLASAYRYLRKVEHRLQLQGNKQTHTLPAQADELRRLAFQIHGAGEEQQPADTVRKHFQVVTAIYDRVIQSQQPRPTAAPPAAKPEPSEPRAVDTGEDESANTRSGAPQDRRREHLARFQQLSPDLGRALAALDLRRGGREFERLLDSVAAQPAALDCLRQRPALLDCIADLVEHSPYLAGYMARFPEDLAEIAAIAEQPYSKSENAVGEYAPRTVHPYIEWLLSSAASADEATDGMRRFYRRQMFRIQARSVFWSEPIFTTLLRSSDLAAWMIQAAYTLAAREFPTGGADGRGMRIIALGRLGMREFDLDSDADIVFVIPEDEAPRAARWTKVANRVIDIVSSPSAAGRMFSMDPRLRPLGRDGELVQTEQQFLSYFAHKAEAWEALTYMKARTIAGDAVAVKRFLSELQDVAWRRFGLSDDLPPLLVEMRKRIEKDQGDKRPIKSGPGGYYDIDFILMSLRLKRAEMFFESLNTLQRIEIIHATGLLDDSDRNSLLDAATFFRALDHAIRVATGSSSSALPADRRILDMLGDLVERWSPIRPQGQSPASLLDEVRTSTRATFNRIFAARRPPSSSDESACGPAAAAP